MIAYQNASTPKVELLSSRCQKGGAERSPQKIESSLGFVNVKREKFETDFEEVLEKGTRYEINMNMDYLSFLALSYYF